ncbi:toprim domain-containing protein [Senegalia massiliensis]|uniref:DUF3854 domain-containing protein n=1 Tax=Senegalia massiliensis TaxID=1720316 RepID=A0A845QZE8_9CLOT|nr:toprim domain-containing protein [Senegalia massiliensis]NBI07540.1 DUF3854 domain-containing protein [Senegalia massiliensis]
MGVTKCADGSVFIPIRSGESCPICGSRKGRCSKFYNDEGILVFYRCKNQPSDKPNNGWYIHTIKDLEGINPNDRKINSIPNITVGEEMSEERLNITDSAYRYFRSLLKKYEGKYLNQRDLSDLHKRGVSDEIVERMKLFSMPTLVINSQKELDNFKLMKSKKLYTKQKRYTGKPIRVFVRNYSDGENTYDCQYQTAIAKDMERKFGNELLKVAGFAKRSGANGDYITFQSARYNGLFNLITKILTVALLTKDSNLLRLAYSNFWRVEQFKPIKGYFIPYINQEGKIQAVQYRLTIPILDDKYKPMRYFWYSSKNARSGSPIDYYIPSKIFTRSDGKKREDILLVTEGALKGKIAAERLGFKTVTEAGVSNYRNLIEDIIEISKYEKIRHKIILALDMDKFENEEVMKAEQKTMTLLHQAGYEVAIAFWDGRVAKGIDDALKLKLKIQFKAV